MTRALFVSHTAMKGGAELFLCELVARSGGSWSACFLSDGPAAVELEEAGAKVDVIAGGRRLLAICKRGSLPSALAALFDVIVMARAVARKADDAEVIWANSQKALIVCALASLLSGKPLVWGLHDILTDGEFSRFNRWAAVTISCRFARIVAVNSRATAKAYVAAGGDQSRVRLVYNGFTARPPRRSRQQLRKELGLDDQPLVGLFGRISPWKGQHVLIDALAREPGLHAVIVGAALFGEDDYAATLRRRCVELGIAGRVHFLGFRDDATALMHEVDIVVHCSTISEPFGRVIAEAMAAARPVIATSGGGIEELVIHEQTGLLVPPDDASALRAAIGRLLADPSCAAGLASRGQDRVASRYSDAAARRAARAALAEAAGKATRGSAQVIRLPQSPPRLRKQA